MHHRLYLPAVSKDYESEMRSPASSAVLYTAMESALLSLPVQQVYTVKVNTIVSSECM